MKRKNRRSNSESKIPLPKSSPRSPPKMENQNKELKKRLDELEKERDSIIQEQHNIKKKIDDISFEIADPEKVISNLKEKIAIEKEKSQKYQKEIERANISANEIEEKMKPMAEERNKIVKQKSDWIQLKQKVAASQKTLQDQRKQREVHLDNLLILKDQIQALDGLIWQREKPEIINEIQEIEKNTAITRKQTEKILKEINELNERERIVAEICNWWQDSLHTLPETTETYENLVDKIINRQTYINSASSSSVAKLRQLCIENDALRAQIRTEKKANLKRIRQMAAVKAEMKQQTQKAREKVAREEARYLQRIMYLNYC